MKRFVGCFLVPLLLIGFVLEGFVQELIPITPENIQRLTQIAMVGHGRPCALVWSADGTQLAVQTNRGIWVHSLEDFEDGPQLVQLTDLNCNTYSDYSGDVNPILRFSHDGQRLLSYHPDVSYLLDLSAKPHLIKYLTDLNTFADRFSPSEFQAVRFNTKGEAFAFIIEDQALQQINLATGEAQIIQENVPDFAFFSVSPDASRLIFFRESDYAFYDLDTHKTLKTFFMGGKMRGNTEALWSPDGHIVAVPNGSELSLWETAGGAEIGILADTGNPHIWSHDSAMLLTTSGNVWEIPGGTLLHNRASWLEQDFTAKTAFSRDKTQLNSYYSQGAYLYRWEFGQSATQTLNVAGDFYIHGNCCALGFTAHNPTKDILATFDDEGRLFIINTQTAKVKASYLYIGTELWVDFRLARPRVSANGALIAFQTNARDFDGRGHLSYLATNHILIWSIPKAKIIAEFHVGDGHWGYYDFSPDGRYLVRLAGAYYDYSAENDMQVYDIATQELVATYPTTLENVRKWVTNPDEWFSLILRGDSYTHSLLSPDEQVYLRGNTLYNTQDQTPLLRLVGHQYPLTNADFSSDGRLLLTGSYDGTARLWDMRTGQQRLVWDISYSMWNENETIYAGDHVSIAFTADDRMVILNDGIYDVASGEQLAEVGGTMSQNGTTLIRNNAGVIEVWGIAP